MKTFALAAVVAASLFSAPALAQPADPRGQNTERSEVTR